MLTPRSDLDAARLFAGIPASADSPLLVAVSGGGDSVALLALLARHFPRSHLVAATVDHALRPGSAAEVDGVAALCARLGLRHVAARWDADKPASGLPAAARAARYRILGGMADACGATLILTGHTADDQAETVAMRHARGEGRGLAGMAPATLLDGRIWLLRPLLSVRRQALRDRLRQEGIAWADDPTNEDEDYERVRVRRQIAETDAFASMMGMAAPAARARIAAGEAAAGLIAAARSPAAGLIALDADLFLRAERATAVYALRLLLATAGGGSLLPDEARGAALLDRFCEPALRASLARVTIERRRDAVYLRREARGLPERGPLADGALWDGRFRIRGAADADIGPLGSERAARIADLSAPAPPTLVRGAAATLPAAFHAGVCLGTLPREAQPGQPSALPVAGPFAALLSAFDMAPAQALARLVGGEMPPSPPCPGHLPAAP